MRFPVGVACNFMPVVDCSLACLVKTWSWHFAWALSPDTGRVYYVTSLAGCLLKSCVLRLHVGTTTQPYQRSHKILLIASHGHGILIVLFRAHLCKCTVGSYASHYVCLSGIGPEFRLENNPHSLQRVWLQGASLWGIGRWAHFNTKLHILSVWYANKIHFWTIIWKSFLKIRHEGTTILCLCGNNWEWVDDFRTMHLHKFEFMVIEW